MKNQNIYDTTSNNNCKFNSFKVNLSYCIHMYINDQRVKTVTNAKILM